MIRVKPDVLDRMTEEEITNLSERQRLAQEICDESELKLAYFDDEIEETPTELDQILDEFAERMIGRKLDLEETIRRERM